MHSTAKKWYDKIGFPAEYDRDFCALLEKTSDFNSLELDDFQPTDESEFAGENLVKFLCLCEKLHERYKNKGIPEEIFKATVSDVLNWTRVYYEHTKEVGIASAEWFTNHLGFKLFKIGRLQFAMDKAHEDIPRLGVKKGDSVLAVHIPSGEPLVIEKCLDSIDNARQFFKKYFPDFDYKCFTCHSWLLDDTLLNLLDESSNIIKFQRLFTEFAKIKSDAVLRYTVSWYAKRESIDEFTYASSLARKVAEAVKGGMEFYETLGFIEK